MHALILATALVFLPDVTESRCEASLIGDGVCDCGCNVPDSDCENAGFAVCERSHCPDGESPWEHQNASCMTSSCGDGWKADGEACDDGNALASGGCNATCTAVNAGYTCGDGAKGCKAQPAPEQPPVTPTSGTEGKTPSTPTEDGGRSATPDDTETETGNTKTAGCSAHDNRSPLVAFAALALALVCRRRSVRG